MLVVLCTARLEPISWKFIRLVGFLVFALGCLAIGWRLRAAEAASGSALWAWRFGVVFGVTAMLIAFLAPLSQRMGVWLRTLCMIGGTAGVLASCLSTPAMTSSNELPLSAAAVAMLSIGQILGALLLGSITVAWLLGHAYLTATKMTIAPLRHFSRVLLGAIALRIAFMFLALGLPLLWGVGTDTVTTTTLGRSWLLLVLRVGVGLVAVGGFAYMVADCVRLRATQSATGILYFGSVFAYVGELAALQLAADFAWPV